jgi:peptide/nickel transport system permease protein
MDPVLGPVVSGEPAAVLLDSAPEPEPVRGGIHVPRPLAATLRDLRTNKRLLLGLVIVGSFVVFGFVLPPFAPHATTAWNTLPTDLPPSHAHLLGTTDLGQDTFWYLVLAVHNSLIIGLFVAALATLIGVAVGIVAGYAGRIVDRVLMLVTDTFIVIPSLPILILVGAILKGRASILVISVVLTAFNWPWPARQARAMTLSLREREFVNTSWFSGESGPRILVFEIFPYLSAWAMANFVNTVLVAIGAEAGLAVIGLSDMQRATLGTMIYWAMQQQALLLGFWYWIASPVVAIVILFLGLFALSSGLSRRSALVRGYGRA